MATKPVASFRIGNVKAAVWKNGEHYNTTFTRSYKEGSGDWKDGDSFGHADLLNLAQVAKRAEDYIAAETSQNEIPVE